MNRKDINTAPLISVIIPCYNSTELRRTLESVCRQSYPAWEVLCVDDGSELDLQPIVASLGDSRIQYHRLARHTNANVARNYGIRQSRGAYIAMLDSDDYWLPDHLESCLRLMESVPTDGVCGSPLLEHPQTRSRVVSYRERGECEPMVDYLLSSGYGAQTSTLFMTADSAKAVMWDESLKRHQDYDFVVRYDKRFRWKIKPEPTVVYVMPEKVRQIDFDSCMRFIAHNRDEIHPMVYKGYHRHMLALARSQEANPEVLHHYQHEFARYSDRKELIKEFAGELMRYSYTAMPCGLAGGKAGVAWALFEAAVQLSDEKMHDRAYDLLQESLEYAGTDISFENGYAGIGFVLRHLIEHRFVGADFDEVFAEERKYIQNTCMQQHAQGTSLATWISIAYLLEKENPLLPNLIQDTVASLRQEFMAAQHLFLEEYMGVSVKELSSGTHSLFYYIESAQLMQERKPDYSWEIKMLNRQIIKNSVQAQRDAFRALIPDVSHPSNYRQGVIRWLLYISDNKNNINEFEL